MKKYDTYKDSGNQWIGQIPEHWKILKLHWICNQIFTGRTPVYSTEPNGLLVFGQRNNQKSGIDFTGIKYADEAFFASRSESEFLLFGDVLLNTLGGGSVGRIGFYDKTDQQVITDGHVMILRTNDTCTQRYLYYSLWAQQTKLEEAAVGSTNQAFLTTSQMMQWRIALPPLSEQQAIVEFLDKKTGQIDQSVALLETQKTDLQAYRQALITEIVTKGLNPNAPMKDSGIQWIGEIPEHWNTSKLKYMGESRNGLTYSPNDVTDSGVLVLRSSNIQDSRLAYNDNVYVEKAPDFLRMHKGDLLICSRNGSISLVGKCAYIPEDMDAVFGAFMLRYRPNKPNRFVYYVVQDAIRNYKAFYATSTVNQLTVDIFGNMNVPLPPLSEQQVIADYLDKKTGDIDAALKQIDTQIADLHAYRTALISEVVTGKIDVR